MEKNVEKSDSKALIPIEIIENKIFLVRGQKVMFDKDLAILYDITTFNLNKAVSRNLDRFPGDFMFRLNKEEYDNLIFHFGISSWGGIRKLPRAFTEHGILMLSSVLRSDRAILVNIAIMRAFVKLRQMVSNNKELVHKLNELERKIEKHDEDIIAIFNAIRQLMKEEIKPKGKIGFL
ncbi:MAG: ORF6N domain-containing protein [Candidatus Saganbacteria bacterium]|nr:ORF6N domain-containing protein [Candidatus Saganbacteria bacterium]